MFTLIKQWLWVFFTAVIISSYAVAKEVKAPTTPLRIITLAPHIVEMLYEVGAGDMIVGTTDHSDFPEQAKEIPRVGNYTNLSIEQILSLDPDLIIAWRTSKSTEDLNRLEKMGIEIIYSEPKVLEDVPKEIITFSKIVGKEKEGKRVASAYTKKLTALKNKYRDKAPISIFFELWSRPLTTVSKNSWLQQQLNVCHGDNLFIDAVADYPQVSIEDVVLKAPEVIIQPKSSEGMNNADTVNWQQWQDIPAVKANAFLYPNANKIYRMTSRVLDELTLLCDGIDRLRIARDSKK